jgi:hypothetical protein
MIERSHGRAARQVRSELKQARDLGMETLLPRQQVEQTIARHGVRLRERLYTPLLTPWTFLYQVLSEDQSCRAAVARLLAFVSLGGSDSASAKTDPYCKARERLPEALVADLARQSGQTLQERFPSTNLLGGRPIKIADRTTLSMPGTPANQQAYPQARHHKNGVGFPILRLVGLISLSCGVVLHVAMGPYRGKQTGETALLRQLQGSLQAGDVLLADGYYANYWIIASLLQQGVDLLSHHDGKRRIHWRQGRRLGRRDHVVAWQKPPRPQWLSPEDYNLIPDTLSVRETAVSVPQKGFRTRQVILVTTLLDAEVYRREELALAYRARWHVELDLRSIKQVMRMEVLRCKTPAMVRKEIWMHLLAYNLVRKLMAEAAARADVSPRDLSFKGTLQTMGEFAKVGWFCSAAQWQRVYQVLLRAIATHRVNNRPDRVEPRAVKRRPRTQRLLNEPRAIAKARLMEKR